MIEDGEDVSGSDEDDMEDSDQSGNITTGSATSNNSAPTSKQRSSFSKVSRRSETLVVTVCMHITNDTAEGEFCEVYDLIV